MQKALPQADDVIEEDNVLDFKGKGRGQKKTVRDDKHGPKLRKWPE